LINLRGGGIGVLLASFTPDGKKFLYYDYNYTRLRDLAGNHLAFFYGRISHNSTGCFSLDSNKVLTIKDKTVYLNDLTGELDGHFSVNANIRSAIFSPDGKQILISCEDSTAKLFNLTGKLLADFKGHTSDINSIVFSPNGKKILTASGNIAKLWDLSGKLLADFMGHKSKVNSAVFSPDGSKVLTASDDGTIKLWLTHEAIIQYLKTAPIYRLTDEDYKELLLDFMVETHE
jgi:WD40 repeat protein